jgi:hygromycin-B 7''-O-kinase
MMPAEPSNESYVDSPTLPAALRDEPWGLAAAKWRLAELRDELPVTLPADLRFIGGASNDVWLFGDMVLRVCWRADRGRLLREARLLADLPATIPHAEVVAVAENRDVSWLISERIAGEPLGDVARRLPERKLRDLFWEVSAILERLHTWDPPEHLRWQLGSRPHLDMANPMSVWASDLVPLPVPLALALVDMAKAVPNVDPHLIDAAAERIVSLSAFDPFAGNEDERSVVHGDATTGNFLVCNGRISAILDFEWARIAPPDVELVSIVRMVQNPPDMAPRPPRLPFLSWLRQDYPRLFEAPDLDERLWLCELAYILRGVIWWPPERPERELDPLHHIHTLRRLIEAPFPRS